MKNIVFIGIDDTDIIGSAGTGRMARDLTDYLSGLGMGSTLGVTRHQLLVDDRIPYTSHNSSLCIGFKTDRPISDLCQPCSDFLKANFRDGSDPGLCICPRQQVNKEIIDFGLRAQKTVLTKQEAVNLTEHHGIYLVELGGTGGGIIGALAAVALRAEGNSGRYVDLPGIRAIQGTITVSELLSRTDIDSVINELDVPLDDYVLIDSRDWIRPSLVREKPVLRVHFQSSENEEEIWTSVEIRERDKKKEVTVR